MPSKAGCARFSMVVVYPTDLLRKPSVHAITPKVIGRYHGIKAKWANDGQSKR